ncbi:aldo/keto reductase [Halobacillus andaensis]|uniref:aldo/keto reductase n=1 Tax=Halobacillus andaensis TaxID=1176239 RepID=UPI003D748DEB
MLNLSTTVELSNGTHIPLLGLGVYKVDSGEEVYQTVQSALKLGYRHIDTASFYGNETGVGQAVKDSRIPREELFITTKVWNDEQGYEETLQAFERSLACLQMDYVDLYLIHWPVPGKFIDTWRALETLYQNGRVRAIGVSNFLEYHLDDLLLHAEITPMVNQVEFHPQLYLEDLLDYCKKNNIQLEAWSPLARAQYLHHPLLHELGEKYGKSAAQIILRWDVQHGVVTIPKSTKPPRQKENAEIFDFELSREEMEAINALHCNGRVGSDPAQLK